VTITIPPLRARREDVPLLARHFLAHFAREFKKPTAGLSPAAERLLTAHDWPGNVRELRNVIERAMILEEAGELLPGHLPPEIARVATADALPAPRFRLPEGGVILEQVEREFVRQALEMTGGNQTRAGHLLGLTRDELRYRVKKFGLAHKPDGGGG
jgi:DNA-binding NtrC family response regulator